MHRGSTLYSFEENELQDSDETQDPGDLHDIQQPLSPVIPTCAQHIGGHGRSATISTTPSMNTNRPSTSSTISSVRRTLLPTENAPFEVTPPTNSTTISRSGGISEEILRELKFMKNEMVSLKRDIRSVGEKQSELFQMVKMLKKGCDSSQFEMGKCCHTDNVNNIIGQFYCLKGRFPVSDDAKKQLLEIEFGESPTGLSPQELMIRLSKYEQSKFSYWRSEERRRLLAIAGYESLEKITTATMTNKILQLVGQRYNTTASAALNREMILTRKFIRETTLPQARKMKDLWGSFYKWKLENWSHATREEWQQLRHEDINAYPAQI